MRDPAGDLNAALRQRAGQLIARQEKPAVGGVEEVLAERRIKLLPSLPRAILGMLQAVANVFAEIFQQGPTP
jgi:hypothetical protein